MLRLKEFYNKYLSKINAYWLVTVIFLALTFTAGDSNLYKRFKYDEEIRDLERQIALYEEDILKNSQKLKDLETDKDGLERFAREEYYMKKQNEDVFIIKKK